MQDSEKTMLELGRTEEVIREMDRLANEDHTHIATEEEIMYTVATGGSVRTLWGPTRCQSLTKNLVQNYSDHFGNS